MREFIDYDSELFQITVSLMKKYNLCSHEYQDWVDPENYDENIYDELALDVCNRLYEYHKHFDIEESIKIVKDIFYFWHGSNAKEDNQLIDKIKLFLNDLIRQYERIEKEDKDLENFEKNLEKDLEHLEYEYKDYPKCFGDESTFNKNNINCNLCDFKEDCEEKIYIYYSKIGANILAQMKNID